DDNEKTRPTNLWHTSLSEQGRPIFSAFRSGAFVDSATNQKEKETNANSKLQGVMHAALIEKLAGMTRDERELILNGKKHFEGNMLSLDLLSGSFVDKSMAEEHHATIERMNGQMQHFSVIWNDKVYFPVYAKFHIIDFQTGVNAMNVHLGKLPTFGTS